ncbi:gluzincin family metallopeptidase [Riemerella columbipharyngis]|uniref:Peptidase M1 membrane alanine aminopeptidase domain-containing protein n=1 Tax=Riemerella columbipharyngis TaxID=1071918 RepID=A0A1G7B415_9FLAO|nr:aminopeptidase [Riemerella columbipharyngis]SDE21650.1 hypothetical protein SAMN05421544_10517 [Riemerella columbipharyngis]
MNKRRLLSLLTLFLFSFAMAQRDSIGMSVTKLSENTLKVKEFITYHNTSKNNLNRIKLLNWIAAYKPSHTPLSKRLLEERKTLMHFAPRKKLGKLTQLSINSTAIPANALNKENIYILLSSPLPPGNSVNISLEYTLQLPDINFTGYGQDTSQYHLKYFFLVPDSFDKDNQNPKYYENLEEKQNIDTHWSVKFSDFDGKIYSNLKKKSEDTFEGSIDKDPEFFIDKKNTTVPYTINYENTLVEILPPLNNEEREQLNFYLPLQLSFIKSILGSLPSKILITPKYGKDNQFMGIQDIDLWKFKLKFFPDNEILDINYLSILAKHCVENSIKNNNIANHWIEHGLASYIEIQYLKKFYSKSKLLGQLPDTLSFFGLHPLKWSNISKFDLKDRYGIAYQYQMTQNQDQPINTPYNELSDMNKTVISSMQAGVLFNFLAEKIGEAKFNDFVKEYITLHKNNTIDRKDFLDQLILASGYSGEFLEDYINHKNRVNFKIKYFQKSDNNFLLSVKKNTPLPIPFQAKTIDSLGNSKVFWYDTSTKTKAIYNIPNDKTQLIVLNDDYIFPEINLRDNYIYTTGFFSNMKKPKFKLFTDIPNPQYNEIFVTPTFKYTYYDKLLIGLSFTNKNLLRQPFIYNLSPYYSTGTGKQTGVTSFMYSFSPKDAFVQELSLGVGGAYFHYNKNLAFKKFSAFSNILFRKNMRSDIDHLLRFSYQVVDKQLTPLMQARKDYGHYKLLNAGYLIRNRKTIFEHSSGLNFQLGEDFSKISSENFFRWEYLRDRKISFRLFGGAFIQNHTRNSFFDFSISSLSNYAFSYSLIRQDGDDDFAPRQFILAEGGFKSGINRSANRWITTLNIDNNIWKIIDIYGDLGIYKNKGVPAKFIWDSGLKLKLIPDVLEIYFPIYSSLGFEPSLKNYQRRIRFMFEFDVSTLMIQIRRGWFSHR